LAQFLNGRFSANLIQQEDKTTTRKTKKTKTKMAIQAVKIAVAWTRKINLIAAAAAAT